MVLLLGAGKAAQQPSTTVVAMNPTGSIPPLPALYSCVGELNGKPYRPTQAESCLHSILASGYFINGRLDVESGSPHVIVRFVLEAPPLIIKTLNFVVEDAIREQMLSWIGKTGQTISAGEVYVDRRDQRTADILNMFFWNIGKRVGVTSNVNLDYRSGTAEVSYRISMGPAMVPVRALPPFNPQCRITIGSFSLTDIDDYTAEALVEKMTETHAFGCFDARGISSDTQVLQNSNLFQEARYDVVKKGPSRDVSVHIRGKHLKVRQVRVVGYGLLAGSSFENEIPPYLKSGDVYRRSDAGALLDYLKNKYAAPTQNVEVYEDEDLTPDNQLLVTFQILAYDMDTVTINGKEFRVAPFVITGTSDPP
jgi:hypothetical protein